MEHQRLVKFHDIIADGATTPSHRLIRATLRPTNLASLSIIRCVMEELEDVSRRNPGLELVVDFHRVGHVSVEILTELIWLKNGLERCGGALHLSGVGENLLEILRITNLDTMFDVEQRAHVVLSSERAFDS